MNDDSILTPTTRFSNRTENYVKYRPGYPEAIIPFFEQQLELKKDQRIADIGSGTGLFAEPLLKKGYTVVCIEPNEDMRKAGEEKLKHFSNFSSRHHAAEATGLRNSSIDLITVAQAFHWMDIKETRKEFTRILKPNGNIVLAWNIAKTHNPFLKAFQELKETYKIDKEIPRRIDENKIAEFFTPGGFQDIIFPNEQKLDFDGLKGQLLSSSYIPLPGHTSYETMISALVQLFVSENENGFVKMEYETKLYWGH